MERPRGGRESDGGRRGKDEVDVEGEGDGEGGDVSLSHVFLLPIQK